MWPGDEGHKQILSQTYWGGEEEVLHRLEGLAGQWLGLATLLGDRDRGQPTEFGLDQGSGDRGRPNYSK
jgi:hypothetical protein